MPVRSIPLRSSLAVLVLLEFAFTLWGSEPATIRGTITDPLGAAIANAKVELLEEKEIIASTVTGADGEYRLPIGLRQRCRLRVSASSFQASEIDVPYAAHAHEIEVNAILSIAPLTSQITVTATGTPTPEAHVGASISALESRELSNMQDVQEALRLIPGLQATQTGQRGGTTSLFIRGGYGNYNKVLLDGVPAGDIGGDVDFADLALAGISGVEVLRAPNSALYGADALAGVVNLSTA